MGVTWEARKAVQNESRSWLRPARHTTDIAMIRVYDDAGNVIETHEHAGEFKEW
jgi:hypothetical protein